MAGLCLTCFSPISSPKTNYLDVYLVHACMLSHFSCVWLCDPMDHSLPGSSVQEILQARILEWVTMPSSRASSWPRDQTRICLHCRQFLYHWATEKAHLLGGEEKLPVMLIGKDDLKICLKEFSHCPLYLFYFSPHLQFQFQKYLIYHCWKCSQTVSQE